MLYKPQNINERLEVTGLWLHTNKKGAEFWKSPPLKQECIDNMLQFLQRPSLFMVWRNLYGKNPKAPEAQLFLYRHDPDWKPIRQPERVAKPDEDSTIVIPEETPF